MATVTCVIATFNRSEELRGCLSSVYQQTRPPERVIVIDDCSWDQTQTIVALEFREAEYVRLPRRCGQIFARNLGVASAISDFIVFLDDDARFVSPQALEAALRVAEDHPDAAVLAFNITDPSGKPSWECDIPPFQLAGHVGAGCMVRRQPFTQVGGYFEPLGFMGEEEELTLRLMDAGWRTIAVPEVVVYHAQSPKNRDRSRIRFMGHRNDVLRELLRCPASLLPVFAARSWVSNTLYNLRTGNYLTDLLVLVELPRMLLLAARYRRPVRLETYRAWRGLRKRTSAR